jgi:hypothetical protein
MLVPGRGVGGCLQCGIHPFSLRFSRAAWWVIVKSFIAVSSGQTFDLSAGATAAFGGSGSEITNSGTGMLACLLTTALVLRHIR